MKLGNFYGKQNISSSRFGAAICQNTIYDRSRIRDEF